jgi:hypothetical protein
VQAKGRQAVCLLHLNEDLSEASVEKLVQFLAESPDLQKDGCVKLLETHLLKMPMSLAYALSKRFDVIVQYIV